MTRKILDWVALATAICLATSALTACSARTDDDEPRAQASHTGSVAGTVRGTDVQLAAAEFDGQLAIYEGDGWGFNPSLLIFLFLDEGVIPEGRTFRVDPGEGMTSSAPHVHYRWRNDSGGVDTEAVVQGYAMELEFGQRDGHRIPGRIVFAVPGEDTHVEGTFVAALAD